MYDDSLLQGMLRAAEARLSSIHALDQAGLGQRLGQLSGATQRISSLGLSVQTPSVPGVTTTDKGATSSTTQVDKTTAAAPAGVTTEATTTAASGAATQDVQVTAPAFAPPAAVAPAASTTLPSAVGVSASDLLGEQMQLTYEIANLRLLLEGALSDHVAVSGQGTFVKPRLTLGFPISVETTRANRHAVGVVEVVVEPDRTLVSGVPPSITALLPRERTYNVAAITDSSMQIGTGVATGILGVSGSWLRGHKTHYVTQDQDTVALTFTPDTTHPGGDAPKVGFRWQFRPVLGKSFVKSGLRQTFVQLAFPSALTECTFGTLHYRSLWRKYDAKKGVVGEVVERSESPWASVTVRRYPLTPRPRTFTASMVEDLGDGRLLVSLPGQFLPGTYVRVGSRTIRQGDPAATFEYARLRFVAPIDELAAHPVFLVARDGDEHELSFDPAPAVRSCDVPFELCKACSEKTQQPQTSANAESSQTDAEASIRTVDVHDRDETHVTLVVHADRDVSVVKGPPNVLVIGGRVFGYANAPVQRSGHDITVVVPLSLVTAHPRVQLRRLFKGARTKVAGTAIPLSEFSRAERLVAIGPDGAGNSMYLLQGSRLGTVRVLHPNDAMLGDLGSDRETMRTLTLKDTHLSKFKQLVLQRDGERPFLLAMPSGARPPTVTARERVIVDADAAVFEAASFEGLKSVVWNGKTLTHSLIERNTATRVTGLKAIGATATPTRQTVEFEFETGKTSVVLDVVNGRLETVAR